MRGKRNKILFKSSVEKDLRKIDKKFREQIYKALEELEKGSEGKKLKGEFKGLYKYVVGNYRIIYAKIPDGILVLRIGNRKDVYRHRIQR